MHTFNWATGRGFRTLAGCSVYCLLLAVAIGLARDARGDAAQDREELQKCLQQGEALRKKGGVDAALPSLEKAAELAHKVYLPNLVNPADTPEEAAARRDRAYKNAPADAPAVFARLADLYSGRGIDEKSPESALRRASELYDQCHELLGDERDTTEAYFDAMEGMLFVARRTEDQVGLEILSELYLKLLEKHNPSDRRIPRVLDTFTDALIAQQKEKELLVPLLAQQKKQEARDALFRGLTVRERLFGADSLEVATALERIVDYARPDKPTSLSLWRRVVAIREAKLPAQPEALSKALLSLAFLLNYQSGSTEAEPVLRRMLVVNETLIKDPAEVASSLWCLSDNVRMQGRFAEAADLMTRATGLPGQATADHFLKLAELDRLAGRYADAKAALERGIALIKTDLLPILGTVPSLIKDAVTPCLQVGEYRLAEECCREGIRVVQARLAAEGNDVSPLTQAYLFELHCLLMKVLCAAGEFDEAGKIAEVARAMTSRDEPRGFAESGEFKDDFLTTLRKIRTGQGRFSEVEAILARRLRDEEALFEKFKARPRIYLALARTDLAEYYESVGDYARAEPLLQRNLALYDPDHEEPERAPNGRLFAPDEDLEYSCSLLDLGRLAYLKGDLDAAESFTGRALKAMGAPIEAQLHSRYTYARWRFAYATRAAVLDDQGRYEEAAELYRRCLDMSEVRNGAETLEAAQTLYDLAIVDLNRGRTADAESAISRSLELSRRFLPGTDPFLAQVHAILARLRDRQGRQADAGAELDRSRRIVRNYVARFLPTLSEPEQLTFLRAKDERPYHQALALAVRAREAVPAALSAGWPLNGKGVVQEALAWRTIQGRTATDPSRKEAVRELLQVRKQLATLGISAPRAAAPVSPPQTDAAPKVDPPQPAADRQRAALLTSLSDREVALSKQLAQGGSTSRWVEVDELRRQLPEGAVFIDVARFTDYPLNRPAGAPGKTETLDRYAVWVVPAAGAGAVRVIDLGLARQIDDAVEAARQALADSRRVIHAEGEPLAERRVREAFMALDRRLLRPLLAVEAVREAKRWIVSPDAALWLVPWGALPLEDGRYAIEAYAIDYVVSGRDLLPRDGKDVSSSSSSSVSPSLPPATPALVVANPDFDRAPLREEGAAPARAATEAARHRGVAGGLKLGQIGRLPGTAAEALAIMANLRACVGGEPILVTGNRAAESVVESANGPGVLILSTHGFFLPSFPSPSPSPNTSRRDSDRQELDDRGGLVVRENPLLRCGLLLAGCNRAGEAHSGGDDGVLTGLEVIGTDLRGTRLVVLSACETGLGEIRNGEGVAGLRQAFQLAGAENVVASLWQVPDRETARLIAGLFGHQAHGKPAAEALRQSQLDLIRSRRERNAGAHPYYWAAFTATISGSAPR